MPFAHNQAVEFRPNLLDDDITGRVVVYLCGLQNHTVDTKSTRHDVIIERIRPFCLSLMMMIMVVGEYDLLTGICLFNYLPHSAWADRYCRSFWQHSGTAKMKPTKCSPWPLWPDEQLAKKIYIHSCVIKSIFYLINAVTPHEYCVNVQGYSSGQGIIFVDFELWLAF